MEMGQYLEIEFKNLLTDEEYQYLFNEFNFKKHAYIIQKNIYFDTPDQALKKRKSALRIRLKDQLAEYTLKTPKANGLLEITENFSSQEAENFVSRSLPDQGEIADLLQKWNINIKDLQKLGSLTTKRYELQLNEEVLLVLDESWYNQQHDFELEMEVQDYDRGKQFFTDFLAQHRIPKRPTQNKIKRLLG